jgi:general stress protein YciG
VDKKPITVAEAGRLGGRKTALSQGREFYEGIGRKGGSKVAIEHGPEFYREIGSKGGSVRAKQHEGTKEAQGKVSLEEAGQRGGQKIKLPEQDEAKHTTYNGQT